MATPFKMEENWKKIEITVAIHIREYSEAIRNYVLERFLIN